MGAPLLRAMESVMSDQQSPSSIFKKYDRAAKAEREAPHVASGLFRIGILRILAARSLVLDEAQRAALLANENAHQLERWLVAATTVGSVAELLAES
jgi:hypothetical protein